MFNEYTAKDVKEVLDILKTSESGLSEKEAEKRLRIYGLNITKEKEAGLFVVLVRQFKSSFFYLLFVAALLAFLIGEITNGLLIIFFVLINVFLGFFQETRAEKAVALLKKYIPSKTRVLREGKEKVIDKSFLVPGDMVLLEPGNIAPADLRIIKAQGLLVDESVLSGESVSVLKTPNPLSKETREIFEAKNIIFAGTSVISGEAEGVVVGTGKETVLGEITKLVSGITRESIYEKNLLKFSQIVLRIVVVTIVFVFLANLIIKGTSTFFEFLIFSIALVVSIVPEALPIVVTFSLSEGARKLAKEKVVAKRLSAIEDLGSVEVLCTDKTGTLTENKLSLDNVRSSDREKCLLYGLLVSSYMKEEIESARNPFDLALFAEASEGIRSSIKKFREISEIPFDPFRLSSSALLEDPVGNKILIVKGAPEKILRISSEFPVDFGKDEIKNKIERAGLEGKRVLAVAFKNIDKNYFTQDDEKNLTFLGYFSFKDPLKKTAKQAISLARKLGVQIKILTGDSQEVAGQIAKEIGLIENPGDVILGETLNSLSEENFEKAVQEFSVFARVSPQIKFRIVEALQKKFEVGFLGEGINDAPALKAANVAIAVKEAADISREAADIILLKKDLKIIIDGIRQGRNIFSNVNKYIKCTLASNFGNFYSIAAISLAIPFLPMLPIQILFVNLLSDFPLIAVTTDKVDIEELRKPKLYQLNQIIWLIIFLALVSTIFDFLFFAVFYKVDPPLLRTLWFIESILSEIMLIFLIRTRLFFLKAKMASFPLIFISVLTVFFVLILPFTDFGHQFFQFVSPPAPAFLILILLLLGYFALSEAVKLAYFRQHQQTKEPSIL